MRYLAIDPGIKCLAWTLVENGAIIHWGIISIALNPVAKGNGLESQLTKRCVNLVKTWPPQATPERVVIEQQYQAKGAGQFAPKVVQQALFASWLWRLGEDSVALVNSAAVRKTFKFAGEGHAANKREATARFRHELPPDAQKLSRVHDLIDCLLMAKYAEQSPYLFATNHVTKI